MPRKKKLEIDSKVKEKLEYIGLDLDKVPKSLKEYSDINFRTLRGYDEKKYKQYRFINVNDIEILLSPTNRINTIKEKYEKAMPLCFYLDSKNEENILKSFTIRGRILWHLCQFVVFLLFELTKFVCSACDILQKLYFARHICQI